MNIKVNFTRKLSKARMINGIVFVKEKKIKNGILNLILKSVLDNELFKDQLFIQREYKNINYIFINCKITKKNEILKIKFIKLIFFMPLVQKTNISLFYSYLLIM